MKNICEWRSCKKIGDFKAPIEKDNSRKFKWLCVEHIKLFNNNWDYFEGMSQYEFESFLRSDLTWHRPTQEFSSSDNFFNILWNNALNDKFKIFNDSDVNSNYNKKLNEKDKDACDTFYKEVKKAEKGKRDEKFYGTPSEAEVNKLLDEGVDLFHVPKVKDN